MDTNYNVSSSHPNSSSGDKSLKLYIVVGVGVAFVVAVAAAFLLVVYHCNKRTRPAPSSSNANASSEIIPAAAAAGKEIRSKNVVIVDIIAAASTTTTTDDQSSSSSTAHSSSTTASSNSTSATAAIPNNHNNNIGWGQWYSLRDLEKATHGFAINHVIGQGGYGIVYKGILPDNSVVAVKNLLLNNNKGQAEKEFKVEVEAIGKVRHKNLASLIGYCAQGPHRMLVYEYLDNGNLEQWLHGDLGRITPLTWDIRIKIAAGTAKGLAYLHEGLEPKVIHRDVKSSNILLDKNWNPRVSDFGLAKLLGSDATYVTTRVMGTFGCVAPEYASTGMLSEGSDVYSFGVLLMEIISGRSPVDYARPAGEVNMVDWFKGMVANRRGEEVVDPLIEVLPSPRALKRALLVCLRCLDLDANKRPKMGQIVHMLEGDEFPFRSDNRPPRATVTALAYAGNTIASKSYSPVLAGARR